MLFYDVYSDERSSYAYLYNWRMEYWISMPYCRHSCFPSCPSHPTREGTYLDAKRSIQKTCFGVTSGGTVRARVAHMIWLACDQDNPGSNVDVSVGSRRAAASRVFWYLVSRTMGFLLGSRILGTRRDQDLSEGSEASHAGQLGSLESFDGGGKSAIGTEDLWARTSGPELPVGYR